jgi:phosphatidylglycerophosphatase GEP4
VAGPDVSGDDLCVVGDRLLTDIVWGNLHGMLTVHTSILTEKGDNRAASVARRLEMRLLRLLGRLGHVEPPPHPVFEKSMRT